MQNFNYFRPIKPYFSSHQRSRAPYSATAPKHRACSRQTLYKAWKIIVINNVIGFRDNSISDSSIFQICNFLVFEFSQFRFFKNNFWNKIFAFKFLSCFVTWDSKLHFFKKKKPIENFILIIFMWKHDFFEQKKRLFFSELKTKKIALIIFLIELKLIPYILLTTKKIIFHFIRENFVVHPQDIME